MRVEHLSHRIFQYVSNILLGDWWLWKGVLTNHIGYGVPVLANITLHFFLTTSLSIESTSIPSYQIIQYAALRTQFAVTFVDRKMIMHPRLAHHNTFYCSAWWGHIATSSSQKQILHCTCLVGPQTYQILSRKTIGPFLLFNNSIPLAASCTHTKNGRVLCISSHD